ncbi:hypothetical protein NZD85_00625 [Empedobacter stercoris]|uniref:Lipoprotein n=2 Tax=Empedobacter TaxID=59734 RepID=A0ABY8VAQ6_9FLAO|nr:MULTISPECIES: hypothetical protein [Empedobacter]MCA4776602.1 hypothetical protein [Empedobacter stercoris]MCA4809747.1 hypothetical protein [Empedobacter stercoris]MDM1523456.1 hypothetical protein [Empedobacter sp. 225-1]MDM1543398.1 hypothetical protein [Empedobacter sp. 189-2]NOJ74900.1 hypothetical protein [Empedobacter stercoris]
MKKIVYFAIGSLFIMQSCEQKKEAPKELAVNTTTTYESALDVPVSKVGVVINIDTVGFFNHNSQELNHNIDSKSIQNQLIQLNSKVDIIKIIREKAIKILDDHQYDYQIIDKFDNKNVPNELITQENVHLVKFDNLKNLISQDDLVVINVKSGLDFDPENKLKYIAKTYVYINILDLKNNSLKYSETIGGTKYIEETIKQGSIDYLEKMMKESLNETLNIIDNKY